MKKSLGILSAIILFFNACTSEPAKEVNVSGNWAFAEHVEGKTALNPQNQAMVSTLVNLFQDAEMEFNEGNITLKSDRAGERSGTYMIANGKLDVNFGGNSQMSLNVKNEQENLVILFGDNNEEETGKIIFKKK